MANPSPYWIITGSGSTGTLKAMTAGSGLLGGTGDDPDWSKVTHLFSVFGYEPQPDDRLVAARCEPAMEPGFFVEVRHVLNVAEGTVSFEPPSSGLMAEASEPLVVGIQETERAQFQYKLSGAGQTWSKSYKQRADAEKAARMALSRSLEIDFRDA